MISFKASHISTHTFFFLTLFRHPLCGPCEPEPCNLIPEDEGNGRGAEGKGGHLPSTIGERGRRVTGPLLQTEGCNVLTRVKSSKQGSLLLILLEIGRLAGGVRRKETEKGS